MSGEGYPEPAPTDPAPALNDQVGGGAAPDAAALPVPDAAAPPAPVRGRRRRWLVAVATVVMCLVTGFAGGAADHFLTDRDAGRAAPGPSRAPLSQMVDSVAASVVSLKVPAGTAANIGTGILIGCDGLILTNNHVVAGAATGGIQVTFSDGQSTTGSILAADAAADLALVRTPLLFGRSAAVLGDSDTVRVGDQVVAIGDSLGLPGSVSVGVVSALHRTVTVDRSQRGSTSASCPGTLTYRDAIQTDAAINQGSSGGPLFNRRGEVIGVNSVMGSDGTSTGSIGIGFAIPINDVKLFIQRAAGATG